jgi:hypothetical protein
MCLNLHPCSAINHLKGDFRFNAVGAHLSLEHMNYPRYFHLFLPVSVSDLCEFKSSSLALSLQCFDSLGAFGLCLSRFSVAGLEMFSRGLMSAGALLCLVQLSAPFIVNPPKSVLILPSKRDGVLPQCTFEGNTDFYGIGVRVGFYCQWFANLIAFVFNPKGCEELSNQQTIFLLANLIAVVVLQNTAADETNAVVPILLFYMFFGSSITAVTSATASLESWDDAIITKKISKLAKHAFVQLTYIGTLIHSFYFWTEGFKKFKVFPSECGGTFVFPYHVRLRLDSPSVGTVLALLLLVLFYLTIWLIAYKRLRRSFGPNMPLPKSKWGIHGGKEHDQYPPWDRRQL